MGADAPRASDGGPEPFFADRLDQLADVIKHDAWLGSPNGDGTERDHWQRLADGRDPHLVALATSKLQSPEIPEDIGYLRDWLYELYGQSGFTMDGAAPLTIAAIREWETKMEIDPPTTEDEVNALKMLDGILRTHRKAVPKPKAPNTQNAPNTQTPPNRRR